MKFHINLYKLAFTALLTASLCACSDDLEFNRTNSPDGKVPIIFSASYPTLTRASDAGFEQDDLMGVFVMDYSQDAPESMNSDCHASNVQFRFNASNNEWKGASDIYWTSDDTPADIVAYYPFVSAIDDPTAMPFSIERRQNEPGNSSSPGGYESSDLLRAQATKVMPTANKIDLTLNHIMSGVRIRLERGDGFTENEWNSLEKVVVISNILPETVVNLSSGEVTVKSGEPIAVTPLEYNNEWRGVVPPQTLQAGRSIISISVGGVGYEFKKETSATLEQGKLHTFGITVNKRGESGNFEFVADEMKISDWIDDTDFREGLIRQYLIVNVPEAGGLEKALADAGYKADDVMNLKIKGKINNRDFDFLRERCSSLKSLNLYDCEVYNQDKRGYIPDQALKDKTTLTHIMWPRYLKIIGQGAFFGTGLMGDLIIPEGVTHIGTDPELDIMPSHWGNVEGTFTNCLSLVGSLSLPSTLEFIGAGAFCRTGLSGDLLIPEKVSYIAGCAFDGSAFSGSLSLPANLTTLGRGAFTGVPLSGTLRIPQGTRRIMDSCFRNCQFNLLVLPEGLEIIEPQAFGSNKIKGELKLPSTLKELGSSAFSDNLISSIVWPKRLILLGSGCFANNTLLSGSIELPSSISAINSDMFMGCTMLEEVIIPESITKIGGGAFMNCYNLTSIIVNNPEPPLLAGYQWSAQWREAFTNVPKDNFTVQVPPKSVRNYQQAAGWSEFKRIAEYTNFVSRPAAMTALPTRHSETITLNSDAAWQVSHCPDWCSVSPKSGNGKAQLTITINEMTRGNGNRQDYIEFIQPSTGHLTRCELSQYDYRYGEDECITLQKASKGSGIDIVFIAEAFDAESIAKGEYLNLVNQQTEAFFGIEPYKTFRDRFNVYAIFSLSQEAGVNTANRWRNNRFGTSFAYGSTSGGSDFLFVDNVDDVFNYAVAHSPVTSDKLTRSLVIMALNCDEYGSATTLREDGAALSICAPSSMQYPMDTRGVVQHEACGHGFGKLADEVISQNRYLTNSESSIIRDMQQRGWYANVSVNGNLNQVGWKHFIFDPRYSNDVDLFEGAFGVTRGAWRSELNSCMNYGIPYFNAISRQAIMQRILNYSGEAFSMEKFYQYDSNDWGSSDATRAVRPDKNSGYVNSGLHRKVRIIKK